MRRTRPQKLKRKRALQNYSCPSLKMFPIAGQYELSMPKSKTLLAKDKAMQSRSITLREAAKSGFVDDQLEARLAYGKVQTRFRKRQSPAVANLRLGGQKRRCESVVCFGRCQFGVLVFSRCLPPDFRPLFQLSTMEVGQAINVVTGTRLWVLFFSFPGRF